MWLPSLVNMIWLDEIWNLIGIVRCSSNELVIRVSIKIEGGVDVIYNVYKLW